MQLACPICKKTTTQEEPTFPFCSSRCRLVDLGNWLDGKYAIDQDAPAPPPAKTPDKEET